MGVAAFMCSHSCFVYGHIYSILEAKGKESDSDAGKCKPRGKGC